MFRTLLLATLLPTTVVFTSSVSACSWDYEPNILLLTTYEQAQNYHNYDRIVYQNLKTIYQEPGNLRVVPLFGNQDDNYYAAVLTNLLNRYHISKVYILNPNFNRFLPHNSSENTNTNLIRVLQRFNNVNFYFFNNVLANDIKVTTNIYDIRFNNPNVSSTSEWQNYGQQLAHHFINHVHKGINSGKYIFESDNDGKALVKVGIIDNIGSVHQQTILDQFKAEIATIKDADINFKLVVTDSPNGFMTANVYGNDSINIVNNIAQSLYQDNKVNFIINSNSWYNDIFAYAAASAASQNSTSPVNTRRFIGSEIVNKNDYIFGHQNYLAFGFNVDNDILVQTAQAEIAAKYKIKVDTPESNNNTYGIDNMIFVDFPILK